MKKFIIIPAFILSLLVLIVAVKSIDNASVEKTRVVSPLESSTEDLSVIYVLKEYDDSLGVFKPNYETPERIIDTVIVSTLNEYDQLLLKNGIEVHSEEELQSLIEDYDS